MKNYYKFFVSLWVINNELWLLEKKERTKWIFATGLFDYAKYWKNFEVSFMIDKRSPIV